MAQQDQKGEAVNRALSRRQFMTQTGAAALSLTILRPGLVKGTQANSKIKLGVIGLGGRRAWMQESMSIWPSPRPWRCRGVM